MEGEAERWRDRKTHTEKQWERRRTREIRELTERNRRETETGTEGLADAQRQRASALC